MELTERGAWTEFPTRGEKAEVAKIQRCTTGRISEADHVDLQTYRHFPVLFWQLPFMVQLQVFSQGAVTFAFACSPPHGISHVSPVHPLVQLHAPVTMSHVLWFILQKHWEPHLAPNVPFTHGLSQLKKLIPYDSYDSYEEPFPLSLAYV